MAWAINLALFLVLIVVCPACVSLIEFDAPEGSEEVIIFGKLTNSSIYDQAITVRRTDAKTTVGLSIVDAQVAVLDDMGNVYPYTFSEQDDRFLPNSRLIAVPGRSYQAQITIGASTYLSTMQRMPTVGAKDSTYFRFDKRTRLSGVGVEVDQYYLQIITDSELDAHEEPIFLKWDVEQVFIQTEIFLPASSFPFYAPGNCFIEEDFPSANVRLFNGDIVANSEIDQQIIADVILDNSFKTLRGYGVVQSSFSREAAQYWERVDEVANRVGSIFEIPPAAIPGNFQNVNDSEDKPLGFFEVSKVDTTGTFVLEKDLPLFLGLNGDFVTCNFAVGQFSSVPINCLSCLESLGVPEACYNCLSLPNSTRKKPPYLD